MIQRVSVAPRERRPPLIQAWNQNTDSGKGGLALKPHPMMEPPSATRTIRTQARRYRYRVLLLLRPRLATPPRASEPSPTVFADGKYDELDLGKPCRY